MQFEEEILCDLKKSDPQVRDYAFNRLYKKYYRLVFFIVSKYVFLNEDKEDLTQTIFMKIYSSIKNIKSYETLTSYISSTAKNESINFIRNRKETFDLDNFKEIPYEDTHLIIPSELANFINEFDANIVILKIYYGYTFLEISELLNQNKDYIQTRYYRAIKQLKEVYKDSL